MHKLISSNDFYNAFQEIRPEDFSYKGLIALYNYLTSEEEGIGQKLDVIAICCEYSEYNTFEEVQEDYINTIDSIEELQNKTLVLMLDGDGLIIANY